MTNSVKSQEIVNQVINQLGGNKFLAMTGATIGYYCQTVCVKFKGSSKANIMYIELNGSDTYTVRIAKSVGYKFTEVVIWNNVYAQQLQSVFTQATGLRTSL